MFGWKITAACVAMLLSLAKHNLAATQIPTTNIAVCLTGTSKEVWVLSAAHTQHSYQRKCGFTVQHTPMQHSYLPYPPNEIPGSTHQMRSRFYAHYAT